MHTPGFFITIEGVEGSGKSALAAGLGRSLSDKGYDVLVTEEPGGEVVARSIRQLLLDNKACIADRAELLLFEAARAQHVQNVIRPALERGAIVISDRFADSSVVYQGCARGIGADVVVGLNRFATGGLQPDLTLLLDIDPRTGLGREGRPNRFSAEGVEFHEQVRMAYLELVRCEKDRFVVIDALLGEQRVLEMALEAVEKLLPPRYRPWVHKPSESQ